MKKQEDGYTGVIRKSWMNCTTPQERGKAFTKHFGNTVSIDDDGSVWLGNDPLSQAAVDDALDRIDLGL